MNWRWPAMKGTASVINEVMTSSELAIDKGTIEPQHVIIIRVVVTVH